MTLDEWLFLRMTYWFERVQKNSTNSCVRSEDEYWKQLYTEEAKRDYALFGELIDLRDKDVLDLGCGLGGKTAYYTTVGPRHVVGVDISAAVIRRAIRCADKHCPSHHRDKLSFKKCAPDALPIPDAEFDIVLMNDVFEHVMDPEAVLAESARVLRPGGFICINFQPWWNPNGHHMKVATMPWAHVFFSERTLLRVSAIRYDRNDYGGDKFWEYDIETGERSPNPWKGIEHLPTVNKMTVRRFWSLIRASGLSICKSKLYSYDSTLHKSRMVRVISRLFPLSVYPFNEFFTRFVVCVLRKQRAATEIISIHEPN